MRVLIEPQPPRPYNGKDFILLRDGEFVGTQYASDGLIEMNDGTWWKEIDDEEE